MAEEDRDFENVSITDSEGEKFVMNVPPYIKEEIEDEAERKGMSQSGLCRLYIQMGKRFNQLYHPLEGEREIGDERSNGTAPLLDEVPRGKSNSIRIEELVERIEEDILDIIEASDELKRDGWEVYRQR
jgi:hypothetical protein